MASLIYSDSELKASARLYFLLRKVSEVHQVDALAILSTALIDEENIGIGPYYATSLLTGEGIMCTCECDIPTAGLCLF